MFKGKFGLGIDLGGSCFVGEIIHSVRVDSYIYRFVYLYIYIYMLAPPPRPIFLYASFPKDL